VPHEIVDIASGCCSILVSERIFVGPLLSGLVRDFPKDGPHASAVANKMEEVGEQLGICQQLG
ncbi:hypothetical protein L208DRAFT_1542354, partial [Tricholoma matsutake]